jgi:hypothetical protein
VNVSWEPRDDQNNRHHDAGNGSLARILAVKPRAWARRNAALGLDRALRPSKVNNHASDALCSMYANQNPSFSGISLHGFAVKGQI